MIKKRRTINIKRPNNFLVISALMFVFSLGFRLYFSAEMAAKNVQVRDLYNKKSELQQEISRLKYDELRLSSLETVEHKALTMGFVKQNGVLLSLDLTVSPPLALK